MGAWGTGLYENDAAREWGERLRQETDGMEFIESTLREVVMSAVVAGYIAERGLVAADVIARIRRDGEGGDHSSYAEDVMEWLRENPRQDADMIVVLAHDAITRILEDGSEIVQIWTEAGDADLSRWREDVDDLVMRLG